MEKPYRVAYIAQSSGHGFSPILEHCETLKFLSTGYELPGELIPTVREVLKDYSPEQDVIVPVGSVLSCFAAGLLAFEKCKALGSEFLNLGIYADKKYNIVQIGVENGISN